MTEIPSTQLQKLPLLNDSNSLYQMIEIASTKCQKLPQLNDKNFLH